MTTDVSDDLIKKVLDRIERDPEFRRQLHQIVQDQFPTRDELDTKLNQMIQLLEKQLEVIEQKFELIEGEIQRTHAKQDAFEQRQHSMEQRQIATAQILSDLVNLFEDHVISTNTRFDQVQDTLDRIVKHFKIN